MNKEDIVRMAREAGPLISTPFDMWCERFAALVAEREEERRRDRVAVGRICRCGKCICCEELAKHKETKR